MWTSCINEAGWHRTRIWQVHLWASLLAQSSPQAAFLPLADRIPCNPLQAWVFPYVKSQMQLNAFKSSKGLPWKLGFKLFWMRQASEGVPWWVQLLLCSMQTDRKASWGMGYFMSIKFFHVNYQIISCQSKSLSTPFLRHSPNRP